MFKKTHDYHELSFEYQGDMYFDDDSETFRYSKCVRQLIALDECTYESRKHMSINPYSDLSLPICLVIEYYGNTWFVDISEYTRRTCYALVLHYLKVRFAL